MKTCKRIFAACLVVSLVFLLASCGTFSKIKKNFTDAGYTYVESSDDDDAKTANTIAAQLEEGEISCTLHIFKKELVSVGSATTYKWAFVLEFKSDAELQKAFEENGSATLKGLITDAQNSDYVNGNCILLPSILDNSEKVEIFNK
ncbi:MAG: hypothetical protein KH382_06740 [Clostridiales bacterium]|nr:hypothetical protein [Clostridiales bacterium]